MRKAGWRTSVNQAAVKAAPMKLEEVRERAEGEQAVVSPKRHNHSDISQYQSRKPRASPCNQKQNNDSRLSAADVVTACRSLLGKGQESPMQSGSTRDIVTIKAPLDPVAR